MDIKENGIGFYVLDDVHWYLCNDGIWRDDKQFNPGNLHLFYFPDWETPAKLLNKVGPRRTKTQ